MMKNIFQSVKVLEKLKWLWLHLYLFKAVLAAVMVLPFFIVVNAALGPSLYSRSLINKYDLSVIIELLTNHGSAFIPILIIFIVGLLIFGGLMQFINGGLYYLMISGRYSKPDWREFFAECGVNFGIHIRISLLMILVYVILIPGAMFFANLVGTLGGRAVEEQALFILIIKIGIIFLVLLAASTFSDAARATAAANPGKPMKELLSTAADFFRPRMVRLVAVFLATYLPFVFIWLLVEILASQVVAVIGGLTAVIVEFVLLQLAGLARTGQKLWYLTNVGKIYRDYNPGRFLPTQAELPLE